MVIGLKYKPYLQSKVWKKKSAAAKELAGRVCGRCGSSKRLNLHHKTYVRLGREKETDLIVLCEKCHAKEHGIYSEDDMLDTLDFNTRNPVNRLTLLMDEAIKIERSKDTPREYLGASRVGEHCLRMLQYEYFNAPKDTPFNGKTLRIFHRGHEGENWMIDWLRASGFDLRTQKVDGGQFGFTALNGKLRGHADGVFVGGPEEFGPWPRLWECKCLGAKGFGKLEKEHLKKAYPVYYAQVQLYMAYFQLTDNPALFTALNANDMDIYAENVEFDAECAQEMSDKAVRIISACTAGEILPRVAQREDWFECKYCDYATRCWHGKDN